jgi:hypothetical protein
MSNSNSLRVLANCQLPIASSAGTKNSEHIHNRIKRKEF